MPNENYGALGRREPIWCCGKWISHLILAIAVELHVFNGTCHRVDHHDVVVKIRVVNSEI